MRRILPLKHLAVKTALLLVLMVLLPYVAAPLQHAGYSNTEAATPTEQPEIYTRAKVVKLIKNIDTSTEYSGGGVLANTSQLVEVLVLEGTYKDQRFEAEYALNFGMNEKYKASQLDLNDEVLLSFQLTDAGAIEKVYVAEFARDKSLGLLIVIFVILLVIVGGARGLKALVSLGLTIFAVIKILLPAILSGWDPVLVSVAICIGVIVIAILLLNGFSRKTMSAVFGTVAGVVFAGIIALIFGYMAKLTGIGDDEAQMLMFIPQNIHLDFRGLLFSGILIGTMGATMDVGMSIASAMHEVKLNKPDISTLDWAKSGMNVGRDVIGTMTDTLILAYAGSSMHLMLVLMAYDTPFSHVINWDLIASEVLRAIAGSIGIIIAAPATVLAAILLEYYAKQQKLFNKSY